MPHVRPHVVASTRSSDRTHRPSPTPGRAGPALVAGGVRIGPIDDAYEREAARVADAVLAGSAAPPGDGVPAPAGVQRLCSACQHEEDERVRRRPLPLQREAQPGTVPQSDAATPGRATLIPGPGEALPTATRAWFEPRLGRDLTGVRIHRGTGAATAAQSVAARAFTLGRDVVFNHGEYDPVSRGGRHLIAHELAHVVQQRPDVVQRLPKGEAQIAAEPETVPEQDSAPRPGPASEAVPGLIIDGGEPAAGQMVKSAFLQALRERVCNDTDRELAGSGETAQGCPYIEMAIRFYQGRTAERVEHDIREWAPETQAADSAATYLEAVTARVRDSVAAWRATGEVSGLPPGLPDVFGIGALLGGLFFAGREGGARAPSGPATPQAVQARLGEGRPLATPIRRRMEGAFGRSFTGVRVHTDGVAGHLANRYNARAFTVGRHVAFGAGQYRPGSLYGDGLLAHELAHVTQQGGGRAASTATTTNLERDADRSAAGVLAGLHAGLEVTARPRFAAGLGLQRCSKRCDPQAPQNLTCPNGEKNVTVDLISLHGSGRSPSTDLALTNRIYKQCCVQFSIGQQKTVSEADTRSWLGGDTILTRSPTCGNVSGEEQAMFDGAAKKYKLAGSFRAFYVGGFTPGGALAYSLPPFCATGSAASYVNHAVVKDGARDDTLAHEFGHILINDNSPGTWHQGIVNAGDTTNLMVSPSRTGCSLDAKQCQNIFNNA